jgi:hypothetical protein
LYAESDVSIALDAADEVEYEDHSFQVMKAKTAVVFRCQLLDVSCDYR